MRYQVAQLTSGEMFYQTQSGSEPTINVCDETYSNMFVPDLLLLSHFRLLPPAGDSSQPRRWTRCVGERFISTTFSFNFLHVEF